MNPLRPIIKLDKSISQLFQNIANDKTSNNGRDNFYFAYLIMVPTLTILFLQGMAGLYNKVFGEGTLFLEVIILIIMLIFTFMLKKYLPPHDGYKFPETMFYYAIACMRIMFYCALISLIYMLYKDFSLVWLWQLLFWFFATVWSYLILAVDPKLEILN